MNSNSSRLIPVAILIIVSFAILSFLDYRSKAVTQAKHGFNRKMLKCSIDLKWEYKTGKRYFFAGHSSKQIFFYSSDPNKIVAITPYTGKVQIINSSRDSFNKDMKNAFSIRIYGRIAEVYDLNTASILKFNYDTKKIQQIKLPRNYSKIVKISPNSYVIKGFTVDGDNQELYKFDLVKGEIRPGNNLLKKSYDAGLSVDGRLLFDTTSNTVVYVHLYSNRVLYLDSNLTLLGQGHTIDTFAGYYLQGKKVKKSAANPFFTVAKPPLYINTTAAVHNGFLYVSSAIKADNETYETFTNNSVIDLYDIKSRAYSGTVYIPRHHDKRILSFDVSGDKIIASYPDAILTYHLDY